MAPIRQLCIKLGRVFVGFFVVGMLAVGVRDFNLNVHAYTNALALAARCPIRFWLARNVNMDIKFCVAAAKGIFIIESINCSVSDAVACA